MYLTSGATQLWERYWPGSADLRDELKQLIATVDNPMLLVKGPEARDVVRKRTFEGI
jgi:hypothetical protein